MTIKPEEADDDIDALEALASEEKEFIKVRFAVIPFHYVVTSTHTSVFARMPKLIVS